ncbi:spore germination protein [Tumebacillus sp. BK434]|uniref:spore germination protein n=1 Tax=Tumebacillus sp. BK434 TaxID=2512169 RepID=UPI001FB2F6AC|nr:spore germination protein [Tumebacillus sp. BK434]
MRKKNILKLFEGCPDVIVRTIRAGSGGMTEELDLIYCENLCDIKRIDDIIIPRMLQILEEFGFQATPAGETSLFSLVQIEWDEDLAEQKVFNGSLLLFHVQSGQLYELPVPKRPKRNVEETNTEVSIRGPRDGFIEDLQTNIALIRKRLRTTSLTYETFHLGKRTKTPVVLMYVTDMTRDDVLGQVRERIKQIDIDVLPSLEALGRMVSNSSYRFFPVFVYSGRPDFAADSLMNGRFVILMDGEPTCMIAPVDLLFVLKTAEDSRVAPVFVMFERLIRLFGLFFAIYLPAFWTAMVVHHQDQIPFRMLATLTIARQGVPLPAGMESFLMLFLFELFREAGARMPKVVGQTLSVVGGLIIGDAAISAGLASPAQVVVVATSVVATSTLVHHSLTGTAVLIRLMALFVSSVLGIYGVVLFAIGMLIVLANLEYFGVPYLSSFNYSSPRQLFGALLFLPRHEMRTRPKNLQVKDETAGGDNE